MDTFVWDQNFVTGLSDTDAQHHRLVDLFNDLSDAMFLAAHREERLQAAFDQVLDYTAYHFRDEEALMRSEGVDPRHTEAHCAMHAQFVAQVQSMWERKDSLRESGESLVSFLTAWLSLHILGVDQSLARQIQRIRGGMTPAQALAQEEAVQDNSMQAVLKLIGNLYHVMSVQNAELSRANEHLEERVAQRTRELAQAHQALQEAYGQLEAHARLDGLLQIANRKYFDLRLHEACAGAHRRHAPVGLLMLDVDYFKRYNDSRGHQAGDACLQAVARAVQGALQRTTDLLARYGGEELAVILPDTDAEGVQAVAERVVQQVAQLGLEHPNSEAAGFVTVSVGACSRVPTSAHDAQTLLTEADRALYASKHAGRNRWTMA